MTTTIDKPKKHISAITAEYRAFWQPLFDNMGLSNPCFGAKLCYQGKEFTNDGSRVAGIRFFPSELNAGADYYTELFDWDQNRFNPANRTLYKLCFNPNWQSEPDKYIEVVSDKLPTSTFAVRLSDLEVVNCTDAKALVPEMVKSKAAAAADMGSLFGFGTPAPQTSAENDAFNQEDELSEMFSDKEDNHYSSMTIRDLYCMLQNVPMSNKKWLNQLISKGKQWQQQK